MKFLETSVGLMVACLLGPAEALAQPAADAGVDRAHPVFVGLLGGYGFLSATHPELATTHVRGVVLGLQAGYVISPRWSVSFEATSFEADVYRATPGEPFAAAASWLRPLAECLKCEAHATGGDLLSTTAHWVSLTPRVDFTPFGEDGLYVGTSAGLAFVSVLSASTGAAGVIRAGVRVRPIPIVSLALEGGVNAQTYADASAALLFGAFQGRVHF